MPASNPFEIGLDRNTANFVPLISLSILERTASVYPDRIAVIHGEALRSWAETPDALPQARQRARPTGYRTR